MPASAVIDLVHLEKYIAGDDALRVEILSMFAARAAELNAALKTPQTVQERKLTLHTLKGGARGIGAWKLGDLCARAETMNGVPEKQGEQDALIGEIDLAVEEIVAAVQSLCQAA